MPILGSQIHRKLGQQAKDSMDAMQPRTEELLETALEGTPFRPPG